MSAQIGATVAAVESVARGKLERRAGVFAALLIAAATVSGCTARTAPLVGADPADPRVKVAGVGYRSTVAPYTHLRPTRPSDWKQQNQRVAPSLKSGQ